MGGGKSSSSGGTPKAIIDLILGQSAQGDPLRRGISTQSEEALRTGGVGAQIPFVQRALEQSMQASGQAQRSLTENLSQLGLANTPFGNRALSELALQGRQQAAAIPSEIAQRILDLGFNQNQSVLGALAGLQRQRSSESRGGVLSG